MNRTLFDDCCRAKACETWYTTIEEIQRDLDKRSHQGYRFNGRTPAQALHEALNREKLPPIIPVANDTEEMKHVYTVTA